MPDWNKITDQLQKSLQVYWSAAVVRGARQNKTAIPTFWSPPRCGEYKINFDSAFRDYNATYAVVLRNHHSDILGAWSNHFFSSNSFCAEMEAALQALKVADEMRLPKVLLEGDAQQVVLSLQGIS